MTTIKKMCKSVFRLNLLKKGGIFVLIFAIGIIQSFSNNTTKKLKEPLLTKVINTSVKSPGISRGVKDPKSLQHTSKGGESDARL